MQGNRKKELDGDCQGTGRILIYLTLLLGMGLCPHPRVQPNGLRDQVIWSERHFLLPGVQSQDAPWRGACLVGCEVPSCTVTVLLLFPSIAVAIPKVQDAISLQHGQLKYYPSSPFPSSPMFTFLGAFQNSSCFCVISSHLPL